MNPIYANSELFKRLLKRIDYSLTGKSPQGMKTYPSLIDFIEGDIFYLSDGGYSRIMFDYENKKIFLTSESREEVKKNFDLPKTQGLIGQTEILIEKYIQENE